MKAKNKVALAAISCLALFGNVGCVSPDAMTDVRKFREYHKGDEHGLAFVGHMTVREAKAAGYVRKNGKWISREDLERLKEQREWERMLAKESPL